MDWTEPRGRALMLPILEKKLEHFEDLAGKSEEVF